jgi:3-oxoacyl-[acyl-carrier protein] reductase
MRLSGKVAIVSGCALGIGRSCAIVYAKEGAKVVAGDINDADGEETVAMIKSDGGEAIYVHADVSVASEVENLVKVTIDRYNKIDILLNVAATPQKHMPIEEMDDAMWDRVYATNVKGIFHTMKYVIPHMKKARSGAIINIGATAGIKPPNPDCSALASSKGAVITLTKEVAMELIPYDVRVTCINPSGTDTPMLKKIGEDARAAGVGMSFEGAKHKGLFGGRLTKPEEIAYAAVFLASDEALMLSGINLDFTGGNP